MNKQRLKSWLSGDATVGNLAKIVADFFSDVRQWLSYPLTQKDPLTCTYFVLSLLAQERGIKPIQGEPVEIFRKRVHYAFINAKDSGSVAGIKRILQRLDFGHIEVFERQSGYDWDEIILQVTDTQLGENQALLESIVKQYGRTCRRYRITVVDAILESRATYALSYNHKTDIASV
jgi:acetoacetate decarboxylase